MRIAHVYKDVYPPVVGGIEKHIAALRTTVPDAVSDVLVCARGRRTTIDRDNGRAVIRVAEFGRLLSTPLAPTFPLWLRGLDADIFHVHMPNPLGELSMLLAPKARPYVVSYHADIVRQARLMPVYRPLVDACLSGASTIIVGTEALRRSSPLLASYDVELIPYAVDTDHYDPAAVGADARAAVRARYGTPLVVAVGRLVYYKGFEHLIAAARDLAASVVIVGTGPLESKLRQLARDLARVHIIGELSEDGLRTVLAAADCFVLPSVNRAESFGIATLEAQAMGVPAVVTDVGTGTNEAIEPETTGLVVVPSDPAALVTAIRAIIEDPVRQRAMAHAARERVLQRHSASGQANAMRRIYETAAAGIPLRTSLQRAITPRMARRLRRRALPAHPAPDVAPLDESAVASFMAAVVSSPSSSPDMSFGARSSSRAAGSPAEPHDLGAAPSEIPATSSFPPADDAESRLRKVLVLWASRRPFCIVRGLVLASCALLFLNAAATIEVVYTLRLSYLLLAFACALGAPLVIEGWRELPSWTRWCALAVASCYLLSAVFGTGDEVGADRGGSHRDLVYLLDLLLGLATLGLLVRLFRDAQSLRLALGALLIGGLFAAAYGVVQWPARHYDWSIANVNNALNPDAVTRGETPQGVGLLLGWERVRGTFTEPLFFGLYLSTILPLTLAWLTPAPPRVIACGAAAALIGFALLLASSFPAWSIGLVAALISMLVVALRRGAKLPAAGIATALVVSALGIGLVLFGSPKLFEQVTGRAASDRALTSASRTGAWKKAVEVWEKRPIIGHGPGQSSVQLAYQQDPRAINSNASPVVLGSAQGLLTSSLVDVGLLGVIVWIAFLTGCLAAAARALWRRPMPMHLALMSAVIVAVAGGLVSGDRLEIQQWIVLGLALALAQHSRPSTTPGDDRGPIYQGSGPATKGPTPASFRLDGQER